MTIMPKDKVAVFQTRAAYDYCEGTFSIRTSFKAVTDTLPAGRLDVLAFSCTSWAVAMGAETCWRSLRRQGQASSILHLPTQALQRCGSSKQNEWHCFRHMNLSCISLCLPCCVKMDSRLPQTVPSRPRAAPKTMSCIVIPSLTRRRSWFVTTCRMRSLCVVLQCPSCRTSTRWKGGLAFRLLPALKQWPGMLFASPVTTGRSMGLVNCWLQSDTNLFGG